MVAAKKNGSASYRVAEYMKIRQYIVGLTVNSETESIMIPSMPKLGEQFGVARMTVHKALKDLVKDGFLVSKPGIGLFTNPHHLSCSVTGKKHRCIGIIAGCGKYCFYENYIWSFFSALGAQITKHEQVVKVLTVTANSPEQIAAEIQNSLINGLAWVCPDETGKETLKLLKRRSFPVVSIQEAVDGVDSVQWDYEKHGYDAGRRFLAENRRNVAYIATRGNESQLAGLRNAYEEAGIRFNERLVMNLSPNIPSEFEALLDLGVAIQAVFLTYGEFLPSIMACLRQYGIDIHNQCRLLVNNACAAEIPDYVGLVRKLPYEESASWAIQQLESMMDGVLSVAQIQKIPIPILTCAG